MLEYQAEVEAEFGAENRRPPLTEQLFALLERAVQTQTPVPMRGDVVEEVGASEHLVRRAFLELADAGRIEMREFPGRGVSVAIDGRWTPLRPETRRRAGISAGAGRLSASAPGA